MHARFGPKSARGGVGRADSYRMSLDELPPWLRQHDQGECGSSGDEDVASLSPSVSSSDSEAEAAASPPLLREESGGDSPPPQQQPADDDGLPPWAPLSARPRSVRVRSDAEDQLGERRERAGGAAEEFEQEDIASPEPSPSDPPAPETRWREKQQQQPQSPVSTCDVCGSLFAGAVCPCRQLALEHPVAKIMARVASVTSKGMSAAAFSRRAREARGAGGGQTAGADDAGKARTPKTPPLSPLLAGSGRAADARRGGSTSMTAGSEARALAPASTTQRRGGAASEAALKDDEDLAV